VSVGRRAIPALLVFAAAIADATAAHGLARALLLCAVPFAAVAAITAFGECLGTEADSLAWLQAILSSLVVVLLVCSCALRSTAVQGVPHAAVSSVIGALAVLVLKAVLAFVPQLRRLSELWPAKP
jgi:hypothetical protein